MERSVKTQFHFKAPPFCGEMSDDVGTKGLTDFLSVGLPLEGVHISDVTGNGARYALHIESASDVPVTLHCEAEHQPNGQRTYKIATHPAKARKWAWSKLRFVDVGDELTDLVEATRRVLYYSPDIYDLELSAR